MKKLSLFLLSILMIFITFLNNIKEVKCEDYYAKSYIVIDMALLLSNILIIDKFIEIESMTKYNSKNHGVWFNKNKLIKQYKYTTSCKTGVAPFLCEI